MTGIRLRLCNFWADLTGPHCYRVWIVTAVTLMGAYFGLYAVIEARHDRQMNESLFERSVFVALASSGVRGDFIAAMKTFGKTQNMEIYATPGLRKPTAWWNKEQPNRNSLWHWARDRLEWCENTLCGDGQFRIVLRNADLRKAKLEDVDLNSSDLRNADLREADLYGVNFDDADLERTDLRAVKGLVCYDLKKANNWQETFRDEELACEAEILEKQEETAVNSKPLTSSGSIFRRVL